MSSVKFPPDWLAKEVFDHITWMALYAADNPEDIALPNLGRPVGLEIAQVLLGMKDLEYLGYDSQERRGASWRSIGYLGKLAGLSDINAWYEVVEDLGFTQRHIGHMIARTEDRLKKEDA